MDPASCTTAPQRRTRETGKVLCPENDEPVCPPCLLVVIVLYERSVETTFCPILVYSLLVLPQLLQALLIARSVLMFSLRPDLALENDLIKHEERRFSLSPACFFNPTPRKNYAETLKRRLSSTLLSHIEESEQGVLYLYFTYLNEGLQGSKIRFRPITIYMYSNWVLGLCPPLCKEEARLLRLAEELIVL